MSTTRRSNLEGLRDHFADRLPNASDRDAAAIGRLIRDIDADLAALPDASEVSRADEIAARREARRTGTKGSPRTARSS